MKYREDAIYWMLGNIRFSRYDRKFINSIWSKRLNKDLAISPKQSLVVEKIFEKYGSQLKMFNISCESLLALPWKQEPKETLEPKFYEMFVGEDDRIYFMSPFNQDLVNAWRRHRERYSSLATWDSELVTWSEDISAASLRCFLSFPVMQRAVPVEQFKICADLQEFLSSRHLGTADQWTVQAKRSGNRIYINNINTELESVLPSVLSLDASCIFELTALGISLDDDIKSVLTADYGARLARVMEKRTAVINWDELELLFAYLDSVPNARIALDTDWYGIQYKDMTSHLSSRYATRITTYKEESTATVHDALLSNLVRSKSYDVTNHGLDNMDICITCPSLYNSIRDCEPSATAKKVIYFSDPRYDPEYYETLSTA